MLEQRIADGALLNLIRKWLRAGILEEDGRVIHPQTGTPQGGIDLARAGQYLPALRAGPLVSERSASTQATRTLPNCSATRTILWRASNIGTKRRAFDQALKARLAEFGLEVAADKTKTLRFGRNGGPHNGRFDFLGFEFYWEPDRKGQPRVKRRTATKKVSLRQGCVSARRRRIPASTGFWRRRDGAGFRPSVWFVRRGRSVSSKASSAADWLWPLPRCGPPRACIQRD